jgi:hypothetical protein
MSDPAGHHEAGNLRVTQPAMLVHDVRRKPSAPHDHRPSQIAREFLACNAVVLAQGIENMLGVKH